MLCMQLTEETYGEAVMMLANVVGGTENSTANQTDRVLMQVADYFSMLATFVNDSDVTVNKTVSYEHIMKKQNFNWVHLLGGE